MAMSPHDMFEVIIEPDVVPKGTLDLRSLDAPPGATPPDVRVSTSGAVIAVGAASRLLGRNMFSGDESRKLSEALEAQAAATPEPVGAGAILEGVLLDDGGDSKTLLAVDQAAKAEIPPRPAAASGTSPRVAEALSESDATWDSVDASELEGGFSAAVSLAKVLVYLMILTALVGSLWMHLWGIAPWQAQTQFASVSPSPSHVDLSVPEESPEPSPEASPESSPEASPAPSPEESPEPSAEAWPEPTAEASPEPTPAEMAALPAVALEALRLLAEEASTGAEVGVEEDEPGLLGRVEGLRKRAVEAYQAGDLDAAAVALEELISMLPRDADAHFRLGVIHHRRADFDLAKERYQAASEYDARDPRPLNNLALVQLTQGAREDARVTLEKALSLAPEDPDVLVNLAGLLADESGRKALPLYDKALSVNPDHGPGRLNRAKTRRQFGDDAGAREDLEHLAAIAPAAQAGQAFDALGVMSREAGRLDEAIALHRQALQRDPTSATARTNLGVALLDLGRAAEALPELEQAVQGAPKSPRAWLALGVARTQLSTERPELLYDAKDAYEEAIKLDGDDALAHHNYALCAERFGNFLFAMREYERAIELDPSHWVSYANLARLYFRGGQIEKSFGFIESALEQAPDQPDLHFQRAWMLAQERRDDEARAALRRFLEVASEGDPRRADAQRGVGGEGS
jgi:tetratricopeptide (TPR) repeat protein